MLPVVFKDRISKAESYPLGAEAISLALAGAPQAGLLRIKFWRYEADMNRAAFWGCKPAFHNNWKLRIVLRASYRRSKVGISTSNQSIEYGDLDSKWEISVLSVPRERRNKIKTLLQGDGLRSVKDWLIARQKVHGRFTSEGLTVFFDEERELLRFE